MRVSLKTITPNAEVNIVEIARVSSSRTDKTEKPEMLIKYLLDHKHFSPFEHSHITMEIVTSKSIGIQLLRHVSFRFQEFSQRYAVVERLEDIEFRKQADKNRQSSLDVIGLISQDATDNIPYVTFDDESNNLEVKYWLEEVARNLENTLKLYKRGIELGIAKECARFILPQTAQTTIYMTGNIRSWIHLLDVRDDSHAQKEVRLIAKEMKKIFIQELPIISKALSYDKTDNQ